MRRVACLAGLLLPLLLRGAEGTAPANPAHAWPLAAAAEPAPPPHDFLAYPATGQLLDRTGLTLKQALAQSAPPRPSLLQIDLNRKVRLAIVTAPRWNVGVRGRARLCVSLLGLPW
jgi:hypothetical protein